MSVQLNELEKAATSGLADDEIAALQRFAAQLTADAVTSAESIALSGAIDATEVGAAFSWEIVIVILVAVLAIVMLANVVKAGFKLYVHVVPTFGQEGRIDHLIDIVFIPIDKLHDLVTAWIGKAIKFWWRNAEYMLKAQLLILLPELAPVIGNPSAPDLNAIRSQIKQTNHRVDDLNKRINKLEAQTGTVNITLSPDSISLQQQIKTLENNFTILYNNQVKLWNDVNHLSADVGTNTNDIASLKEGLHAVRAEQVSYSTIQKQLQDLVPKIQAQQDKQGAQIHSNTQAIGHLSPLTLLLQPGLPGLRNLRKLEDDPCQCPQPPHLSMPNLEALSILEFAENG